MKETAAYFGLMLLAFGCAGVTTVWAMPGQQVIAAFAASAAVAGGAKLASWGLVR